MRNKNGKRAKSRQRTNGALRQRGRRQRRLESLESRELLAGTPSLIDLNPLGASDPSDFTPIGAVTFFVADDGTNGRELWSTDGTPEGTSIVRDIRPGADSSAPQELVAFQGELFFVADDGVSGQELWRSDGTESGTVLVRDIHPGTGNQYPYPAGPLQSFPRSPVELNGRLFFGAEEGANGAELWASDGTTAGTALVSDIFPSTYTNSYGTYPNSSNVQDLVNVDGTLFFTADDGVNGRELWKSDGNAAGTAMVKDLFTGTYSYANGNYPNSSNPQTLTAANGLLFFVARDADGVELWRSDGTDLGTLKLQDINPGSADAFTERSELAAVGNLLLFTADDGTNGDELWRSDGSISGTSLLKDIHPGSSGNLSSYSGFTEVNGELFFSADDGQAGRELWKSDGTAAGTVLVKDINGGQDSLGAPYDSYPFYMASVDGTLYFSAATEGAGRELWQSDGTESGTMQVADVVPGVDSVFPNQLERAGNTLVFSADDGGGRELWALAQPPSEARLTIYVDGSPVTIPADIGVNADGSTAAVYTEAGSGQLLSDVGSTVTLGSFFNTWCMNAGLAGNNANAVLSNTQLLSNIADNSHTVQMFVNGVTSDAFGSYVLQDGDELVLVYGDNPVVAMNTNLGAIVIELFEDETPGTVANFLNYVNDGDYINSFFHRSATFSGAAVIQGGGFITSSTAFTSTAQFSDVPSDPPILNEPGISNVRGTIAMAKTSDPNSATSQFFINLNAANTLLDNPNNSGGFTVFGQVLDMTIADTIAALPINTSNSAPYGELPLTSSNELAVIQAFEGRGEITGVKFSDANANGIQDAGELGIAGIPVYVDTNNNGALDTDEPVTLTAADGTYLLQVDAGTHTVRSPVSPGTVATAPTSPDSHLVTVEIGRAVTNRDFGESLLLAPSGVDLLPVSDSGSADNDNLTRFNNTNGNLLQFDVTGVAAGAEVRLFSDGVQIGSAVATTDTATVVTDGTSVLTDGMRLITATQAIAGNASQASPGLTISIDASPPAPLASTPPETGQAEQAYSFNADSPDEGQSGIGYALMNAPAGMTIDPQTGLLAWTPTAQQAVPQSFAIDVLDAAGNTASQVVALTVLGVIPAFPNQYSTAEDITLNVDVASGVLANDGDVNSGALTAAVVDDPANGTLTLNPDGSLSYIPNGDFFGEDAFTYIATDGVDDSNVARVTITVTAVNDPTAPTVDSYTGSEDVPLAITADQGVLANDTDVDGDMLAAAIANQATNGTVALTSDGSFVYTPNTHFNGSDSFSYTVSDGTVTSSPVTVDLSISEVADPPSTMPDAYSVNEDATLTVDTAAGLLNNDSDPDSATLTVTVGTRPAHGSLAENSDGSFTYTPTTDYFGDDSFTYVASDGALASSTETVTITVTPQADAPTANADPATAVTDGGAVTIDVLANDSSEPDGQQALSITAVTQGTFSGIVSIVGTAVSYTPDSGFIGTETFTYTIQDTDGLTDTATVTVTVAEANNNTVSGFVYIDANGDGLRDAGEAGIPGAQITLTGTGLSGAPINLTLLTTDAGFYSFAELPAGTYEVSQRQPIALADGPEFSTIPNVPMDNDSIGSFSISGGQSFTENNFGEASILPEFVNIVWFFASSLSSDGMFRETIARAEEIAGNVSLAALIRAEGTAGPGNNNAAPVAVGEPYSTDEDQVLTVVAAAGVLDNDSDADGDALTATLVSNAANGFVTLLGDGSFTYTPNADSSGTDSFTYRVSDGLLDSTDATATVTVLPVNDPPVAVENTYTATEDTPLAINGGAGVLANDTDAEGDPLTAAIVQDTINGTLTLNPDGSFSYTPNSMFNGADSFTYRANDGTADSLETTVGIIVAAASDVPQATIDSYSVDEDLTLTVDATSGVLGNDTDADSDVLTATLIDDAKNGTLALTGDGAFSYIPNPDFSGSDAFTYVANDGALDSTITTVSITVNSIDDDPQAVVDQYSASEDSLLSVDAAAGVLANDSDADDDNLTATLVDDVTDGTLALSGDGSFTYLPNANFSGADSFTYTATDGAGTTIATLATIDVVDQNTFSILENSPADTLAGQLSPEGDLGATVVYSVDDPSLAPALEIAADDHLKGDPSGSVVLIEYLDFQCPACRAYHPVVDQLLQSFPDDLMVVTRHLPLEGAHANALVAAVAAEAAGRQGAFDAFGDLLFQQQDDWDSATDPQSFFESYANQLSLDLPQFRADQADPSLVDRVRRDANAATALGAPGTPTFFLNGQAIANPPSQPSFAALIQAQVDAATDVFDLDRLTGRLTVRDSSALDFETNPNFPFTVNAIGLSGSETILATVLLLDELELSADEASGPNLVDQVLAEEGDWLDPFAQSF